uniref:Uncharacterized protein n=1 Tax=Timema bartmani TaxID=61472 RepID=A0A7R9FD12_9NEOP|nr:unnamed protein product [Timema bartmani]
MLFAPVSLQVYPTEIRTSISPSSAIELNTTSALANHTTEAGNFTYNLITDGCYESLQLFHFRNCICISNMGRKSLFIFKTDFRNLGKVVNTFTDYESRT